MATKHLILSTLLASIISLSAHTSARDAPQTDVDLPLIPTTKTQIIEGSYIVTFKERTDFEHPLIAHPDEANKGKIPIGKPTSGQSEEELAATLNLEGKIVSILELNNAIIVKMSAEEANRLRQDERVLRIDPSMFGTLFATQNNPGWGLDRLDEQTVILDNTYSYTNTGAGRTIYILDSGLTLSNASVAAEFGGRASVIWDVNGGNGADNIGHGTMVSSAAAGSTKGVAKGATVVMAKVVLNSNNSPSIDAVIMALDWLAVNAPKGSIVNISIGFTHLSGTNSDPMCSVPIYYAPWESAVRNAHNAGIIVVVAAGNDTCNTANFTPTNIPESFVVGATDNTLISSGKDAKASFSRTGFNISTFNPGVSVLLINQNGTPVLANGTSFSAPYIAGVFAIACQAAGQACNTATTAASLYQALRNEGTLNTVTNTNGTPLTGATSRFIPQKW